MVRQCRYLEEWPLGDLHTVDIDLILLHKLPQPRQALRGIDSFHICF